MSQNTPGAADEESDEDLEWELQKCFAAEANRGSVSAMDQIRKRVVEGVVDRILREWDWSPDGKAAPIEADVVENLIERIFSRLNMDAPELQARPARTLPAADLPANRMKA